MTNVSFDFPLIVSTMRLNRARQQMASTHRFELFKSSRKPSWRVCVRAGGNGSDSAKPLEMKNNGSFLFILSLLVVLVVRRRRQTFRH